MMGLRETLAGMVASKDEAPEEIPDDVTRDKGLRSLRRQKRVMDEEEEKEMLKKEISERNKRRTSRFLIGSTAETKDKDETILIAGNSMVKRASIENVKRFAKTKKKKKKQSSLIKRLKGLKRKKKSAPFKKTSTTVIKREQILRAFRERQQTQRPAPNLFRSSQFFTEPQPPQTSTPKKTKSSFLQRGGMI